jgi:NADH dehydrogenase/NADH:ubiquinone oxidoreductase subunit G
MQKLSLEEISDKTRFLLLFGTFLWDQFPSEDIQKALSSIRTKVLFSAHDSEFNSMFDIICPVPLTAEKTGSLTNVDGFIQTFTPAMEAPGKSLPEWKLLTKIGLKMNLNYPFYKQFSNSSDVFQALKKEVPFFGKE